MVPIPRCRCPAAQNGGKAGCTQIVANWANQMVLYAKTINKKQLVRNTAASIRQTTAEVFRAIYMHIMGLAVIQRVLGWCSSPWERRASLLRMLPGRPLTQGLRSGATRMVSPTTSRSFLAPHLPCPLCTLRLLHLSLCSCRSLLHGHRLDTCVQWLTEAIFWGLQGGWAATVGQDFELQHRHMDFMALHLWPSNWATEDPSFAVKWIQCHVQICQAKNKPCVLEEVCALQHLFTSAGV